MHTNSSWHPRNSKCESIYFYSGEESTPLDLPLSEPFREIGEATDLVTISLVSKGIVNTGQISRFHVNGRVVALTLPMWLIDRAWQSRDAISLLVEIETAIRRLGYTYHEIAIDEPISRSIVRRTVGRWYGWRRFSTKAAKRAGGIALAGSVLEETLEILNDTMPRYARWICRQTLGTQSRSILEIGAGTGTMTRLYGASAHVVAAEPADEAREQLIASSINSPHITVVRDLEEAKNYAPYDQILLINVLEHVDNDVALLREARHLLSEDGLLTVLSPAHNILYSNFDAKIGHLQRYSRKTLVRTFELAGFKNVEVRYFNLIGAILWLVFNRVLKRNSVNKQLARFYDRFVTPVSSLIDRIGIRSFGQSVIASSRNH